MVELGDITSTLLHYAGCPIPDYMDSIPLPALSIPRLERRVLGSIYGSARPERDFPRIADVYLSGRLPLDRLVSHRLPLAEAERAFALMNAGEALRVVLDPSLDTTNGGTP